MFSQFPPDDYLDMFDDEDTDSESSDSHDDDISIVVKSSDSLTTQKKIFRKKTNDEDLITDFDKEMENELSDTVNALECVRKFKKYGHLPKTGVIAATTALSKQSSDGVSTSGEGHAPSSTSVVSVKKEGKCEQYDDIYFDSDEELEKIDSDTDKHPVLSNDDLFYDPDMDTRDQLWMDERRLNPHKFEFLSPQKRKNKVFKKKSGNNNEDDSNNSSGSITKRKKSQKSNNRRAPKSDAILDCPACMTTLCIDCQKHATFPNQYRAMFVMNCTIDFAERFRYPQQQSAIKKKKRQVTFDDDDISNIPLALNDETDDLYYSVKCDECNTKVAMYDKDEVYHFFNVISSYG